MNESRYRPRPARKHPIIYTPSGCGCRLLKSEVVRIRDTRTDGTSVDFKGCAEHRNEIKAVEITCERCGTIMIKPLSKVQAMYCEECKVVFRSIVNKKNREAKKIKYATKTLAKAIINAAAKTLSKATINAAAKPEDIISNIEFFESKCGRFTFRARELRRDLAAR